MISYLLSVYNPAGIHEREFGAYDSAAEMEVAFARVAEFNASLENAGLLLFAVGLSAPTTAVTVDPDGALADGPGFDAPSYLGGFWAVRVSDFDVATRLAARAAAACGQRVEVRLMEGEDEPDVGAIGAEKL